jgi:hypothetical protein
MVSTKKQIPKQFNTVTVGLTVLKQELEETRLLNFIDLECPKNSGYPVSGIVTSSLIKNILNIQTYTETSEELKELPEFHSQAYRTTLARNIRRVGKINTCNMTLTMFSEYFLNKFKINPVNMRIVVDGTTIEVSPYSKSEGFGWV